MHYVLAPILEYPNWHLPFNISTGASDYGIGGFLSQSHGEIEKPIAFISRALKDCETRYSVYEKET